MEREREVSSVQTKAPGVLTSRMALQELMDVPNILHVHHFLEMRSRVKAMEFHSLIFSKRS